MGQAIQRALGSGLAVRRPLNGGGVQEGSLYHVASRASPTSITFLFFLLLNRSLSLVFGQSIEVIEGGEEKLV